MIGIVWDEAMSTGVAEIDEQHKQLLLRINQLLHAMARGAAEDEIRQALDFVEQYAKIHFSHEEQCMHVFQCPAAQANKTAHGQFIETFKALRTRFETDGPSVALVMDIQRQLVQWFNDHIRRIDSTLRSCVKR